MFQQVPLDLRNLCSCYFARCFALVLLVQKCACLSAQPGGFPGVGMLTTSNTALSSLRPLPASLARRPFVCCPGAVRYRSHLYQPIATRAKLGGGGEGDKGTLITNATGLSKSQLPT